MLKIIFAASVTNTTNANSSPTSSSFLSNFIWYERSTYSVFSTCWWKTVVVVAAAGFTHTFRFALSKEIGQEGTVWCNEIWLSDFETIFVRFKVTLRSQFSSWKFEVQMSGLRQASPPNLGASCTSIVTAVSILGWRSRDALFQNYTPNTHYP